MHKSTNRGFCASSSHPSWRDVFQVENLVQFLSFYTGKSTPDVPSSSSDLLLLTHNQIKVLNQLLHEAPVSVLLGFRSHGFSEILFTKRRHQQQTLLLHEALLLQKFVRNLSLQ